jgi:hypothetical protein
VKENRSKKTGQPELKKTGRRKPIDQENLNCATFPEPHLRKGQADHCKKARSSG